MLQGHVEQPQGSAKVRLTVSSRGPGQPLEARGPCSLWPNPNPEEEQEARAHVGLSLLVGLQMKIPQPPEAEPGPALPPHPAPRTAPRDTLSIPRSSPRDMAGGSRARLRSTSGTWRPRGSLAHGPQLIMVNRTPGRKQKPPAWDSPLQGALRPETGGPRAEGWPALQWLGCPPHRRAGPEARPDLEWPPGSMH